MTLVGKDPEELLGQAIDVLFREAHQRRRRRRVFVVLAVLGAVALALGLLVGTGGGRTSAVVPPTGSAARFTAAVEKATAAAGVGTVSIRSVLELPRAAPSFIVPPRCQRVENLDGSLDLTAQSMSLGMKTGSVVGCRPTTWELVRQFGSTFYDNSSVAYKNSPMPYGCPGIPCVQPWVYGPPQQSAFVNGPISIFEGPFFIDALRTAPGAVRRIGVSTIDGETVTQYALTPSLADLQTAAQLVASPGRKAAVNETDVDSQALPLASEVDIPVRVWIDSLDRLVRLSASEPYFVVEQSPTNVGVGPQYLAKWVGNLLTGTLRVTVSLSNFGSPPRPTRPPAGLVQPQWLPFAELPRESLQVPPPPVTGGSGVHRAVAATG